MTNKTSRESFGNYRRWMKYIRSAPAKMPDRHDRNLLLLYCYAKSTEGTNGLGCYAGDEKLANDLDWNRDTVRKYKKLAIEIGWFVKTGARKGRAEILDIAIPDGDAYRSSPVDTDLSTARTTDPAEPEPWFSDNERLEPEIRTDGHAEDDDLLWKQRAREQERQRIEKLKAEAERWRDNDPWAS